MAEPNFKGLLQMHCQKAKVELPKYSCTQKMQGHSPVFSANLVVLGQNFTSEGEFSTKKQAEKSAAKVALRELRILGGDFQLKSCTALSQTVNEGFPSCKVDQSCTDINSGSTTAVEEIHKDMQVSTSPEKCEEASIPETQMSSPEIEKTLFPSNPTVTPVSRKGNGVVSFKNVLQERAQKTGLALPQYETVQEGGGFVCTVTFNGQCFKSEGCSPSKKLAQQNAAAVAFKTLTSGEKTDENSPLPSRTSASNIETPQATNMQSPATTPEMFDATVSYKNLLQENCQQRGNKPPTYSTTWEGTGFISTVCFGDVMVSTKAPYTSKKQAEQAAAREALLVIGVSNPEEVFVNKGTKKNKLKRKFAPMVGQQRTSWVHFRGIQAGGWQSSDWGDADFFWEQAIANKRQKLDPNESLFGRSRTTFALPLQHRRDLSVGEIWKEKKNVVIVGDAESSFILYCTRVPGTCKIFNTRTMSLVELEPGFRIVGLDAQYSDFKGKVALEAERCANVIIPETPDPVLTSCGVVLLYQDPQSSLLQVLLKRYLSSQAFVNVAAALAQYFRRKISGRPVTLDVPSLTEHIRDWMLEEVQNIATMNEEALQHVFSYMWKFNKRWISFLNPPLPHDLEFLKASAADELARRQASEVHHSEDFYHPWGLPKGNFKHRMISTGLFIEPAADCAVRELKEETGIKLDADEVKNSPQVDLLQTDNFNPHKGDMVKYFLYVYRPHNIEDDLNNSQDMDQLDSSNNCEAENGFTAEVVDFDGSTIKQNIDGKNINEENDEPERGEPPAREQLKEETLITDENFQGSMAVDEEKASNLGQVQVSRGPDEISGASFSVERRGVKRKRDPDDDNYGDNEMESGHQVQGQSTTPMKGECSLVPMTADTCTSVGTQEVITAARSPHVQSSVHEECAWFTLQEARIKSPVFEQISQTEQFKKLLNSITSPEER